MSASVPLHGMTNDEVYEFATELVEALTDITRSYIEASSYPFPQCVPSIEQALKCIARANGASTFGNDWMDAIPGCPL